MSANDTRAAGHDTAPLSCAPDSPYYRAAGWAGLLCSLLGAIVLIGGWGFGISSMRTIRPDFPAMKPNTALGLLVAGFALWNSYRPGQINRALTWLCLAVVLGIGVITLGEYATGANAGIDELLFLDTDAADSPYPGRIAPITAVTLIFVGCALWLVRFPKCVVAAQLLACGSAVVCIVNFVAFLYGERNMFGLASHIGMAIHTSLGLILLSIGILLIHPEQGLMAAITSDAPGGHMARRMLPAAVAIPTVLGWLRWQGQLLGYYDTAFGVALFACSNIVVFASLSWLGAHMVNRSDAERLLAERKTLEHDRHYRTVVESLPQMVWTCLPDGRCDYLSPQWVEYTGIPEAEQRDYGWAKQLHPGDSARVQELWNAALRAKSRFEVEYRIRSRDGEFRWFRGLAIPLLSPSGEAEKWFGTSTDIQDLKDAEWAVRRLNDDLEIRVRERTAELSETRAQLQSVLDSATQVSIIAADIEGVIRIFNTGAENMLGYRASEVAGIYSVLKIHCDSEILERAANLSARYSRPVEGIEALFAVARERGSDEREWTYVRRDGTRLDVRQAVTSVLNTEGAIVGFLCIATDITGRKSLERQLRRQNEKLAEQTRSAEGANRAKSAFLASMSHEIRTPMNSILGMADLLWETDLSEVQRQYVNIFRRSGSNLLTLVNDLLDLSKIESGHFELECIEFNLEDVVDEVIELIGSKARDKGIGLYVRLTPGVETQLVGDPTRTRQVLINLLGNAVKFTESGEVVATVSGNPGSGLLEFSVADTGIGIPASKLAVIFEDFAQADSSTTRKYGGSGLGLAISRKIAHRMGGELTVTSSPGKGSTFRFTAQYQASSGTNRRCIPMEKFSGNRVMIVDGNSTNRTILRETLGSWGLETHEFDTASNALAALCATPYAAVILDNRMPGTNGLELASEIRMVAADTAIIMLTSDSQAPNQAGLAGYAIKPVKRSDLFKLVWGALDAGSSAGGQRRDGGQAESAAPAARSLQILVAEDSPDNRLLIQAYLSGTHHVLSFAENGREAVEMFTAGIGFDIVLMDIQMPEMDGLEAARAIRGWEARQRISPVPILAISANARPEDLEMSRKAGCNAHLSKPIAKKVLLNSIDEYGREDNARGLPPIRVEIPAGLEDLVPGYLNQRRHDAARMPQLLSASNLAAISTLAHNMKGTGSPYGFADLTRIGAELESAAKRGDRTAIAAQIGQLDGYLARVRLTPVPRLGGRV